MIPFLPNVPHVPARRRSRLSPPARHAAAPEPAVQAPAGKGGGRGLRHGGKTPLPLPSVTDARRSRRPATTKAERALVEAAVKELLQRKQGSAEAGRRRPPRPRRPTPRSPMPAPVEARAPVQAPGAGPVAPIPAPALTTMADQAQPALAPTTPQPATIRADAAGAADGHAHRRSRGRAAARSRPRQSNGSTGWRATSPAPARATTPLRFRLHPQTLGHLQVELQQGDRGTAVRLTVETEAARQLLADAQPRLAAEARAQGVRIAETHVDLSGSGRHAPGDQRRQDDARQSPMIRTARGPDADAVASTRSARRARLDRYA